MDVYIASEDQKDEWDNFVKISPRGTFFHTWDFLDTMHVFSKKKGYFSNLGQDLFPLIVKDKGKVKALCPIFVYNSPLSTIISSPAYGVENFYLGPVTLPGTTSFHKTEIINFNIFSTLDQYFKFEIGADYIQLNTCPGDFDIRYFKWNRYRVIPRYTYIIKLDQKQEIIWRNFTRNLRYYITKSDEYGITVCEGSENDIHRIYDLLNERKRIHPPKEYLIQLFKLFNEKNLKIFVAKKDNITLTGLFLVHYKDRAQIWIGCPKFSYRDVSPNESVMWEVIKWAQSEGYDSLEIMGADDPSLFYFKSKFNAQIIPYYSLQWATPLLHFGNEVIRLISKKNII